MQNKVVKVLITGFALLSPFIPLSLYFWGNLYDILNLYSVSMFFGIISYIYFINVLIISTRLKFLDSIFGHDKVMQFHGGMAFAALILGLLHRFFKLKVFTTVNEQMQYGIASILIFLVIISLTLLFMVPNILQRISVLSKLRYLVLRKLQIDYSIFKMFHNFMIAAIVFLSVHVFLASSTQEKWERMIFMPAWAAVGIILWIWHKIIKPFVLRSKRSEVTAVNLLNENVVEISFSRTSIKNYKPGQFVFIRFPGSNAGRDEHPFTLSSAPDEDNCKITAKALGNFSQKLKDLSVGNPTVVDGPYGIFTLDRSSNPVVFIAGGIGITPFYSMLKANTLNNHRSITLFWGVQSFRDLIYHDELKMIAESNEMIEYLPVISENENDEFETGYITKDLLMKYLTKEPAEYHWYFCGPPAMRKFVFNDLTDLGVKRKNIFYESFSL